MIDYQATIDQCLECRLVECVGSFGARCPQRGIGYHEPAHAGHGDEGDEIARALLGDLKPAEVYAPHGCFGCVADYRRECRERVLRDEPVMCERSTSVLLGAEARLIRV